MKSSLFSSFNANGMKMQRKDAIATESTMDLLALLAISRYHHMIIIFENRVKHAKIVHEIKNFPILNRHPAIFISVMQNTDQEMNQASATTKQLDIL